ncbi:hypothetical protein ACS2L4_01595 [Thermofilum pendens]
MTSMQNVNKGILLVVLVALLSLIFLFFLALPARVERGSLQAGTPTPSLKLDWRVAVVSDDPEFVSAVASSLSPRELSALPADSAGRAVGYDLVVVGWDALPRVSGDPELVLSLLRSGRVLAVSKPGEDALYQLFSRVVKPVKLGEGKTPPEDPFAFLPLIERDGYLYPGCGCEAVLVETQPRGGKLAAYYTVTRLESKQSLVYALMSVLQRSRQEATAVRLASYVSTWMRAGIGVEPAQVLGTYIGHYTSVCYDVVGPGDSIVGCTDFGLDVGLGIGTRSRSDTYRWVVEVKHHGEKTWSGFSPPVKMLGLLWVVEPSSVVVDSLTGVFPDQRLSGLEPASRSVDGQVSVFLAIPPGIFPAALHGVFQRVTWESDLDYCSSSFYGGAVACKGIWRWGLTGYDGSGSTFYLMASVAEFEALDPLYFDVAIKANGYFYSSGVMVQASSGVKLVHFRASTSTLTALGGG